MNNYQFKIQYPANRSSESVAEVLKELLIPRKWRHFLRIDQQVLINGKYLPFNFQVNPGDYIELNLQHVESTQQNYPASGKLPRVIYEDNNLLIIDKPAGQKTHPNLNETNTALNDCCTYLGYSPFIVHRLDMLTHGLLLIAKNPAVVPILNRQLTNKTFHRDYYAWIQSANLKNTQGTIDQPIGQDPLDQRKRIVSPNGQKAITHYQTVSQKKDKTLLKIKLDTGRTHQIRVHLAYLGCPIIGDPLYNPNYHPEQQLQLEAYRISFIEPFSFTRKTIYLDK